MKLLTKTILSSVLISVLFSTCKKGEDDPFFSLRTRKNRVVGEWKLKSGRYTINTQEPGYSPEGETYEFSESHFTYALDIPGSIYTGVAEGPYSRTIKFTKDGKVNIQENIDGYYTVIDGTWDFNDGIGEAKKKQFINIHVITYNSGSGTYSYSGNQTDLTFEITELRNKKMVLYSKNSTTEPDGSQKTTTEKIELNQ